MIRPPSRALLALLVANIAGALLVAATLWLLSAVRPVSAEAETRDAQAPSDLRIGLTVDTGNDDPSVAFNGEIITYTIRLTNPVGAPLANVEVLNSLPIDTLTNITCIGAWSCFHIAESKFIPEPLGGTIEVTVTRQLTWMVSSIAGNSVEVLQFTGRVAGQADGTVVNNVASVLKVAGVAIPGKNANIQTTVRVPIANEGHAVLSNAATWFSSDLGGTLSQDWGDLNRDGYMDLVLGSSVGASVFVNENGRLRELNWSNDKRTYGVRWADFTGDDRLDLVLVGESEDGQANNPGTNYIYGQFTDPVTLSPTFGLSSTFISDYQLVRVGVGDFNNDGHVDIIASTNSINAPCPVLLYRNNGTGNFNVFPPMCVSTTATAAIGPGDFDNDGDLDVALGLFPDTIKVFLNNGGVLTETNTVIVDDSLPFLPYDFAWGDYSADGKLDLAAAFPLQKEARIFRNKGAGPDGRAFDTGPDLIFRTASFLTPLAVDWGDFNGDGLLDLMVADEAPKVYLNQPIGAPFSATAVLASDTQLGQKWGLRGGVLDFGGDLSLAITNRDRPSLLLEGFSAHLKASLTEITQKPAGSIAWGDADHDGDVDMLLGAGDGALGTTLHYNFGGSISSTNKLDLAFTGIGPHQAAFGDVDGNRRLEIAVATPGGAQLYQPGATQTSWTTDAASHVAFADANSDGRLDLLTATAGGGISLYLAQTNGQLNPVAVFVTQETGEVRDLVVADFNRDFYPDFAVAFANAPARVYLNNKNNSFTSVWNSGTQADTRSVAWGDYNVDGYPDLAVGHYQGGTALYQNMTGTISADPVWVTPTMSKTTALAWGDWDNDGYPDLAIGNENEPTQVYANLRSEYNLPRLFWLWSSIEHHRTTGLAWGDVDGDGDLDLGYSQDNPAGFSGYYENGTNLPSHHSNAAADYLTTMRLPNNPPYVDVPRPGDTSDAYLWSSSEILGLGSSPTVTIRYVQYDPDGARRLNEVAGDPLARVVYEFSLDGGATWKRASAAAGAPSPVLNTHRQGVVGTFIWDARKDQAISDDARFRVRVVPQLDYGPTQRGSVIGVSPPFRIRALAANCIWPDGPNFALSSDPPVPGATTFLTGSLLAGTGPLTYTWQFSDRVTPTLGQVTTHEFITATTYGITLTVAGPNCPVTRPVVYTRWWGEPPVSTELFPQVYVPFMALNPAPGVAAGAAEEPSPTPTLELTATETATPEVTPTETATLEPTPTETVAPEPEASPTATETPTDEPTATSEPTATPEPTPTDTLGAGLAGWALPSVGAGLDSSLGNPTVRAGNMQMASAAGSTTQLFVTNTDIGISNEPTVSSDGRVIAFWSTANLVPSVGNADGNIELFLAEMGSPIQYTQVTSSTGSILGGFNLSPSMDESGTHVAFFSDRDLVGDNPENSFQIFLYDRHTLDVTQVTTRTRGFNILPSLSGNGQYIAFVTDRNYAAETDGLSEAEGNSEIARAEIGEGGVITLTMVTTTTNQSNDQPRIDYDGDRIAFVSTADLVPGENPDNNREVFVASLHPDGSVTYAQLTHTDVSTTIGQVSISSDGTYVAYMADKDPDGAGPAVPPCVSTCRAIYRATLDANGELALTEVASTNDTEVGLTQPSISADGTRIAYISTTDGKLILHDVVSGLDANIDVTGNTLNPAISAGGTAVAFASSKQIMWAEFPLAELTISKSVEPQVTFPGELLRYTVVVSNAGPSVATNVVVSDVLQSTALTFIPSPDQIDNSGGASGFGGTGVFLNTEWDTDLSPDALRLSGGTSGLYTSRIMDAGEPGEWSQLAWEPNRPYGKPLPNNGVSETDYDAGNANMTNIRVLLHLDETSATETYVNSASSVAPPGRCSGGACPQTNVPGQFNGGAQFDGSQDHLDVNVLPNSGAYAAAFWFKTECDDCGLMQFGQGQLGNLARDRQLVLDNGSLCAVLAGETICANGDWADGTWHHVVHIYGNPAQADGAQRIYMDGALQATGTVTASALVEDAVLDVGYSLATPEEIDFHNPFFAGTLDELAIFDRSLTESQISDMYLRGALKLQFQARTCNVSNCSDGGSFVGPGGSSSAYYSEATNFSVNRPSVTLDGLPQARYFQYEVTLLSPAAGLTPRLQRVEIGPSHGAIVTSQGFCSTPVFGAATTSFVCDGFDLDPGEVATITAQLRPTDYGLLTNVAQVTSDVDEHSPINIASVAPEVLPLPIEAFTVTLAGVPGLAGEGHIFTATVGPITASVPVTYIWQATNQNTVIHTSGLTNTNVFTWFTGGPQVITVTALNAADQLNGTFGLTATLSLTVSNPVPHLTAISPTSAVIDSGAVNVVITGTQFVGTSQVRWNGTETLSRTVGSSTRITATVPVTLLQTAGEFPIRIFNPTPGGGLSPETITFTVNHPRPVIDTISPTTITAGVNGFDLVVTGTNFYPGATLYWQGAARPTVVNTATQTLTATISAADVAVVGNRLINVENTEPNLGPSDAVTFTVTPLGLTLEPENLSMGILQTRTVTATISAAQAANRTITVTSSSNRVTVPPTVIIPAGSQQVTFTVQTGRMGVQATVTGTLPLAQGGAHDTVQILSANPKPAITGTNPVTASAGGITLSNFEIYATDAVTGVQVYWNGNLLPSSLDFDDGIISAEVAASFIQFTNTAVITAVNPLPNTGPSNDFLFTTTLPALTLAPATISATVGTTVPMTVTTDTPRANDTIVTLASSSPTTASVPASVTILAGTASATFNMQAGPVGGTAVITASLPPAYGSVSDTTPVSVNNPPPMITQLTPNTVTAGDGSFVLTIEGSGFISTSRVRHGATEFAVGQTHFVNSGTITVTVPATVTNAAGFVAITVHNPAPPVGGLTSNAMTLTVQNQAPTITMVAPVSATVGGPTFTLTVTGTNFINGAQVYFDGQARTTGFVNSDRLTVTIPASAIATLGTVPITVTNPAPTLPSPSNVAFDIVALGVSLSPTDTITLTAGTTTTAQVSISAIQNNATVVTITESPDNVLNLPVTVTVPAGSLSANFTLTAVVSGTVSVQAHLPASLGGGSSEVLSVVSEDAQLTGLTVTNNSPRDLASPAVVAFTATVATGTNPLFTWDFGDGTAPGSGATPNHVYTPQIGRTYTVVVTATNTLNTITGTTLVVFNNITPTLSAIGPMTFPVNSAAQTLYLTGTHFITGTLVNINGVPRVGNTTPGISNTMTVTLNASDLNTAGLYTVTLTSPNPPTPGRDSAEARNFRVLALSAANSGPRDVGATVNFTATITPTVVISYTWSPGDGSGPFNGNATFTHSYTTAGIYTATVTAQAGATGPVTATTIVTVNHLTPTIQSFSPTTTTATGNFVITITGTNFVSGTVLAWDAPGAGPVQEISTNVSSSTVLTATIPPGGTSTAGNYNFWLIAPAPPTPQRESTPQVFVKQ